MIYTQIHQFGVLVWKMQRRKKDKQEEQEWRGGKETTGRDCEPRRKNCGLFLVSSCVSHSETFLRRPTGEVSEERDCNTSL